MLPVKTLSIADLLVLHAQIGEELRERGVVRSANNPTGDLAEYLFCRAAALIPIALVVEQSTFVAHTNSNKFILRDEVWKAPGVRDVTAEIAAAMP